MEARSRFAVFVFPTTSRVAILVGKKEAVSTAYVKSRLHEDLDQYEAGEAGNSLGDRAVSKSSIRVFSEEGRGRMVGELDNNEARDRAKRMFESPRA